MLKLDLHGLVSRIRPIVSTLSAPVLSVVICSLLIVIRPISRLSGRYAFLVLTIETLFFFPGTTVGAQIETSVVVLLGGTMGLAWSCLCIWIVTILNNQHGGEAQGSRILAAFFMAIAAFTSGYVRSSSPRLGTAARLGLFHCIWILSGEISRTTIPPSVFLTLFYPTVFAAGAAMTARLVFPRTSVRRFIQTTQASFRTSERLLLASVDTFFCPTLSPETALQIAERFEINKLRLQLLSQSSLLKKAAAQMTYELSFSKFSPFRLLPFISSVQSLKQDLATGVTYFPSRPFPQQHASRPGNISVTSYPAPNESLYSGRQPFESATREFAQSLVCAFAVLHSVLEGRQQGETGVGDAILELEDRRVKYVNEMDASLGQAVADWEIRSKEAGKQGLDKNLLQTSLFSHKILGVAHTLHMALVDAGELVKNTSRKNSFHRPHFSKTWLVDSSIAAQWDESEVNRQADEEDVQVKKREKTALDTSVAEALMIPTSLDRKEDGGYGFPVKSFFLSTWDSPMVMNGRTRLSRLIDALKERRSHFRHAFKVAVGLTMLTLPAWLPPGHPGRRWFEDSHGPWIPISFLFVLEATTGQTYRVSFLRIIGTVGGSILAYIVWLIARQNPYALVCMSIVHGAITASFILLSSTPGIGVVASITLPPVVYIPYLGLPYDSVFKIAYTRTYDVLIGIAAAVVATEVLFPSHARVLFLTSMATSLDDLTKLYLSMSRELLADGGYNHSRKGSKKIQDSLDANIARTETFMTGLRLEISLVHKPLRIYRRLLDCIRRLSDLFVSISLIRERIPRRATVLAVIPQRKEIVSAVLIHLFTTSSAFRSRLPLPQFLPSPRVAFEHWEYKALRGLIPVGNVAPSLDMDRVSRIASHGQGGQLHSDLEVLYAFAEAEALEEAISILEELTDLARALFGSATFVTEDRENDRFTSTTPYA